MYRKIGENPIVKGPFPQNNPYLLVMIMFLILLMLTVVPLLILLKILFLMKVEQEVQIAEIL